MTPQRAGTLLVVSGVINSWFFGAIAWAVCGNVCGGLTSWMGNLGGLWGWAACLVVPFGWLEIYVGLRTRSTGDLTLARRLGLLQFTMLLFGAVHSALVATMIRARRNGPPSSRG